MDESCIGWRAAGRTARERGRCCACSRGRDRLQEADPEPLPRYPVSGGPAVGDLNWSSFGYEYAAADATPLFIMAGQAGLRSCDRRSGFPSRGVAGAAGEKGSMNSIGHSDTDGVYDNSQGTGWVEVYGLLRCRIWGDLSCCTRLKPSSRAIVDLAMVMQEET